MTFYVMVWACHVCFKIVALAQRTCPHAQESEESWPFIKQASPLDIPASVIEGENAKQNRTMFLVEAARESRKARSWAAKNLI